MKPSAAQPAPLAVSPAQPVKVRHPIFAIRSAAVPICGFESSDINATVTTTRRALQEDIPQLRWDVVRGLTYLNKSGQALLSANSEVFPTDGLAELTCNPAETLRLLALLNISEGQRGPVCFFLNAHRFIGETPVMQAVANLRDVWKRSKSTLVLLGPKLALPDELVNDVLVVDEALPTPERVEAIIRDMMQAASLPLSTETLASTRDTLMGMSAFAVEQTVAVSVTSKGIDRDALWQQKRKMVEATPGLTVWRGDDVTFDKLGGLANIKSFLSRIMTSNNRRVRCVGFLDEVEKSFAGSTGDTSGVSQDQLRVFLTEMQDANIPGIILVGPPGVGKSAVAKAAGHVADAEVLSIDIGAMTGSLVGESQAKIRKAMQTFKAVSQGSGIFLATCNSISSLPPELRRRFYLGTFFIDLPSAGERAEIWKIWRKAMGVTSAFVNPADHGWTGAEIRACCDVATRMDVTLVEAAEYIVPVSVSAADRIDALRRSASGKFINASAPGVYTFGDKNLDVDQPGRALGE